jgi:hypothetical protein
MKITKERLIEIIKEELEEAYGYRGRFDRKKGDLAYEIGHEDRPKIVFPKYEPPVRKKQTTPIPKPKSLEGSEKRYIDFLDDLRYGGGIKPEEQEFYEKVKADIVNKTKSKDERTRSDAEHQLRMLTKAGG